MNLKKIRDQIINTKSWTIKSYLLNRVFIQGYILFPNSEFKNFSNWLDSFKEEAKNQGVYEGYSKESLMMIRTTGEDYIYKTTGFLVKKEQKASRNESRKPKIEKIELIKECKVKSYKALHLLKTNKEYTKEQKELITSGKLERKHVLKDQNNVAPLFAKLKTQFKENSDALKHIEALEKMAS